MLIPDEKAVELLALDEALRKLAKQDAWKSRIVELRYFGSCTGEETAQCLGISAATVARKWRLARAWLQRELGANPKAVGADES